MKKRLFAAVLMMALLLSACGNQNDQIKEGTDEIKKQETEEEGREFEDSKIVAAIEDRILSGDIATADALEKFYSDGVFDYYFSSIKSEYVVVYYSDGTEETVETALNEGRITISDLDRFDIHYYREGEVSGSKIIKRQDKVDFAHL